jgi:hypothetical protein
MKTTRLLTIVLILQGLILVGQWLGNPSYIQAAPAQIPDGGAQRNAMIDELKTLNGKMDRLIGILESGKLEVRVAGADDNKGGRR